MEDKDGHTPIMVAAIERCEKAFDLMVKAKDGIRVVEKALLHLAQASPQQCGNQTTFNKHLKVKLI